VLRRRVRRPDLAGHALWQGSGGGWRTRRW